MNNIYQLSYVINNFTSEKHSKTLFIIYNLTTMMHLLYKQCSISKLKS
ncbi:hypothetical protein CAXC1_50001 [Candidatus Xenohaliotis californiensis]|uniref:Uncharacterized protein n=1 Tax=Candidatus Xenohaliotis californiensis TaxID=84677 RepID=A0ABM9N8Z1_9RICK|nr:hypothetical protein CAXC1_50001 [Candidatus Xenohaliotis californiensis]